jgi:hypothetical protein
MAVLHDTEGEAVMIPWQEQATLIRFAGRTRGAEADREIVFEAPLYRVVAKVAGMLDSERRGLSISLPDRQVRPFTFDEYSLAALIADPLRPHGPTCFSRPDGRLMKKARERVITRRSY